MNGRAGCGDGASMTPRSLRASSPRSLLASCLTLVAALAASTGTARGGEAPADTLRIRAHGAVDAKAIAGAIAAELGVATTLVDTDAACTAPCISISVDDRAHAAIVVVMPDATRQRTIDLPASPGAAAEVVALVVGNLARDEASALLADRAPATIEVVPSIAPPPAHAVELGADAPISDPALAPPIAATTAAPIAAAPPATAPPAAAPRDPEAPTRFAIGLVPPLALDLEGARGTPGGVAIDLVIGGRRRLAAFNVAGVGSIVTEDMTGTQIGGAFTAAGRIDGAQIAGAVAAARHLRGTQIAGAVAAAGDARGTQIAGAVAAAGDTRGTQIAGGAAIARDLRGTQIAGGVAIARDVHGVQLSPINVARRLDGVQVGVVNVAGGGDGVSIGLLNLVRGGRTELEATLDHRALGTVVLRHGSRRWHNVYGVGGKVERSLVDDELTGDDAWMYGLGFGPSWQRGRTTVDVEAMAWHVVYGDDLDAEELDLLGQLRLVVGHPIGPASLVVGGALNAYVTTDEQRRELGALRMAPAPGADDVRVTLWPSAFVGLRL